VKGVDRPLRGTKPLSSGQFAATEADAYEELQTNLSEQGSRRRRQPKRAGIGNKSEAWRIGSSPRHGACRTGC